MTAKKNTVYLQNCEMIVASKNINLSVWNEKGSSLEMTLRTQWSSSPNLKMVKNNTSREQSPRVVTPASDLDQQWRRPSTWIEYHVKIIWYIPTYWTSKDTAHNTNQRLLTKYFYVIKTLREKQSMAWANVATSSSIINAKEKYFT